MIGEDADLEKSGRILNRVIGLGSSTASQSRRTRDTSRKILKDLELERCESLCDSMRRVDKEE